MIRADPVSITRSMARVIGGCVEGRRRRSFRRGREDHCAQRRVAGADKVEHVRLEKDHRRRTDQRDQIDKAGQNDATHHHQDADGGDVQGEPHRFTAKEDNDRRDSQRNEQNNQGQ